jgi:galactokinase
MDQLAVLHGRADAALLLDCASLAVDPVPLVPAATGRSLLVIDTRVTHAHDGGGYARRQRSCEEAARILGVPSLRHADADQLASHARELGSTRLRRARHVITENRRVLDLVDRLRGDADPVAVGELLLASHRSMREDFEISCPELDLAVATATGHGADGARLTGGGLGGCVIVLCPRAVGEEVRAALRDSFDRHGYPRADLLRRTARRGPGAS